MKEKLGLIKTTIRLVKRDEELIERILVARDRPKADRPFIAEILRHNMWTVAQFRDLTGYGVSTIVNKTRPQYRDEKLDTELDFCYPFADLEGLGPKFIVRNEKSEAMLPQPEPIEEDAV